MASIPSAARGIPWDAEQTAAEDPLREFSPWFEVFNLQTCTLWLESGPDENCLLSVYVSMSI